MRPLCQKNGVLLRESDLMLRSITGTPAGIGWGRNPKLTLHGGDEFVVEILPHIGSLYNVLEDEK